MLVLERLTHGPDADLKMGLPVLPLYEVRGTEDCSANETGSSFPVNCLDRHVHVAPDKVALIWERDEPGEEVRVTYRSVLTSEHMRHVTACMSTAQG